MSEDPRSAQTKGVLQQALLALLKQGDWDEISVSAICRRAGVARSSFYEHYQGKAELLDHVFASAMAEVTLTYRRDRPLAVLEWLVDHVADAPEFFSKAMAGGRGDAMLPRFRDALIHRLTEELIARRVSDARTKAAYVIGGSMSLLAAVGPNEGRAVIHETAARIV